MKKYKIAREVREQILERVKNGGVSVTDAAKEHGVNPTTVYEWLKGEAESGHSSLEIAKLKKENLELKLLVAELSLKVSEAQKKEVSEKVPAGSRAKARLLGISRAMLWYRQKKPEKDWALKVKIEETLHAFPGYGYRRVALHLKENKKKVQRVMHLFGIKAYRRRARRWKKPRKQAVAYPNLLMQIVPAYPHHAWVADFTHLAWNGRDIRIATTMDVYTRIVLGIAIGTRGGTVLVTAALGNALLAHPRPVLFHSDNGVEYGARSFRALLERSGIHISRSRPGCPWENGYQESFYGKFKAEFGDPERFTTLGELCAEIYVAVHRYNTLRIHSALRMSPRDFAATHAPATL